MKFFVPFFLNQKAMHKFPKYLHHNMKYYHVSQPLCTSTYSTDLVTDHDNLVVKSIVIHTIPKYHLLIYKTHSKVLQENNVMRHFSSPKYLIGTQNVIMKNYSCQKPCDFLNEQINEQECPPLRIPLCKKWIKGAST